MFEIFSERLIEQRNKKGLTQSELAAAIDKKRSTISGYETEGKEPNIETLCQLADFFGVTVDYLVGISNTPGNRDDILFKATAKTMDMYLSLSADEKDTISRIYTGFYKVLETELSPNRSGCFEVYADLLSLVADCRAEIKKAAEHRSFSEILTVQNDFKYQVEALLDRLLLIDLHKKF